MKPSTIKALEAHFQDYWPFMCHSLVCVCFYVCYRMLLGNTCVVKPGSCQSPSRHRFISFSFIYKKLSGHRNKWKKKRFSFSIQTKSNRLRNWKIHLFLLIIYLFFQINYGYGLCSTIRSIVLSYYYHYKHVYRVLISRFVPFAVVVGSFLSKTGILYTSDYNRFSTSFSMVLFYFNIFFQSDTHTLTVNETTEGNN